MYICGVISRKAGYKSILIRKVYGIETLYYMQYWNCGLNLAKERKTMKPLHCFLSVVVKNEQLRDMGNRMVGDGVLKLQARI